MALVVHEVLLRNCFCEMLRPKIKFVDLFAGLCGIGIGLEQAAKDFGLTTECVFTSEIKESALRAYSYNFHEEQIAHSFALKTQDYGRFQ